MDFFVSFILLVLSFPLFLIIAVLIKLDSRGPVFFNQMRIGQYGKPYVMYKFRTMFVGVKDTWLERFDPKDIENYVFQEENDPRVTRVGKFLRKWSLDELPNLINVFIGNMSLVGPRSEMPEIVEHYPPEARKRLEVKPGITGLSQVRGRAELPLGETLRTDIEYVENHTIWLDIKILLKTPFVVLTQKGAR
jgi:lipopolysaccharide/colanic/teichoic acid biosynthesis glycosyltransferase